MQSSAEPKSNEAVDKPAYTEFNLVSSNPSAQSSRRYHVMKFNTQKPIDMAQEWTTPIKLHRKMPTLLNPELEAERANELAPTQISGDLASNLEAIAPYGGALQVKQNPFKKKTRQVFHVDKGELALRAEEKLPWLIEDYDKKKHLARFDGRGKH